MTDQVPTITVDHRHTEGTRMKMERIRELVACCACREPMAGTPRVNVVVLERKATWEYPASGNVLSGHGPNATAIVCDRCLEGKREILVAVEFRGQEEVLYHPVAELEPMPPEPTFVLVRNRRGDVGIRCLRCGLTSWHPEDVKRKFCANCGEFHMEGATP